MYTWIITGCLFLGICFVGGQIDVSMCTTFRSHVDKCNTDNPLYGFSALTLEDAQGFFISKHAEEFCTSVDQTQFRAAVKCIIDAYRACGANADGEFFKLVGTGNAYAQIVDTICENKEDWDSTCTYGIPTCIENSIADMNLTRPGKEMPYTKHKAYYCEYAKHFSNCVDTDTRLAECSKNQTKPVLQLITHKINPHACGKVSGIIYTVSVIVLCVLGSILL